MSLFNENNYILLEIIEKNLKRKIESIILGYQTSNLENYIILTDKGYIELHISEDPEPIKTEVVLLEFLRKKRINIIPNIIFNGEVEYNQKPLLVLLEERKGIPLVDAGLTIFDYNKVLAKFAEALVGLHAISLNKFGTLTPLLSGKFYRWNDFLLYKLDEELDTLKRETVLSTTLIGIIRKLLIFKEKGHSSSLLHGHISTNSIYIDSKLHIATIGNFVQPVSGDPNYELAGFLLYDGFDRARRLINYYYLLGGLVEWDSPQLLKMALRRSVKSLYTHTKAKGLKIMQRKQMLIQIIARLKK